jgi:hypothetical protein
VQAFWVVGPFAIATIGIELQQDLFAAGAVVGHHGWASRVVIKHSPKSSDLNLELLLKTYAGFSFSLNKV